MRDVKSISAAMIATQNQRLEKLYWTFQTEKIGDLVSKSSTDLLSCKITFNDKEFSYRFGKDTTKTIQSLTNRKSPRASNFIFLPAKEVLSIYHIILESREKGKLFDLMIHTLTLFEPLLFLARAVKITLNLLTPEKLWKIL